MGTERGVSSSREGMISDCGNTEKIKVWYERGAALSRQDVIPEERGGKVF